jgi:hypothetical protein
MVKAGGRHKLRVGAVQPVGLPIDAAGGMLCSLTRARPEMANVSGWALTHDLIETI